MVTKWSPIGHQVVTKWSPGGHQVDTRWSNIPTSLFEAWLENSEFPAAKKKWLWWKHSQLCDFRGGFGGPLSHICKYAYECVEKTWPFPIMKEQKASNPIRLSRYGKRKRNWTEKELQFADFSDLLWRVWNFYKCPPPKVLRKSTFTLLFLVG